MTAILSRGIGVGGAIAPLPDRERGRLARTGMRWRALPPALAVSSCGCFLPDLTRFTTLQCGEARHWRGAIAHREDPPRRPTANSRRPRIARASRDGFFTLSGSTRPIRARFQTWCSKSFPAIATRVLALRGRSPVTSTALSRVTATATSFSPSSSPITMTPRPFARYPHLVEIEREQSSRRRTPPRAGCPAPPRTRTARSASRPPRRS